MSRFQKPKSKRFGHPFTVERYYGWKIINIRYLSLEIFWRKSNVKYFFNFLILGPLITCAVVFGVCFVIVPFSHCVAFGVHTVKMRLLTRNYLKLYSSDEILSDNSVIYSGFDKQAKSSYESDVFDIHNNVETKGIVKMQNQPKRTRHRTVSGCYSKLQNLPDSDL